MEYRPTAGSFFGCLPIDLSPAATASVIAFLKGLEMGILGWVLSAGMGLLTVLMLLNTVFVHLTRLDLDETGIRVRGLFGLNRLSWREVRRATLRERKNAISRTDRLLILEGAAHRLNYPVSVLSDADEARVLEEVRNHARLVVLQDRPAI